LNHLAHFYLARRPPCLVPGALAADHVKGRLKGGLARCVEHGILLHRSIDAFTDRHPATRRAWRRFAPVVVDVLYDHLLARDWSRWSPGSLVDFGTQVYDLLDAWAPALPETARHLAGLMRSHDTLRRYADPLFVQAVLERLSHRMSRPLDPGEAWLVFGTHRDGFASDFSDLFPDLIRHTAAEVASLKGSDEEPTCLHCQPRGCST
jgi:acyl carrier protein phosphodiesterase